MINVNQITSQLAKMPDQALQKYASLNKSDPYILSLAVAESNRRKEMRQAAQGAPGMMPQPKVADQAVQSMAPALAQPMPEDMGIGRLPAGDMNFADGGIVAFADGGDVERYQVGGLPPLSAGTEYGVPGMDTGSLYQQAMVKAQQGKPLSDVEKALLASVTPLAAVADTAMLPITALRKIVRSPLDKSPEPSWFPLTGAATSTLAKEALPEASYSNEGRRNTTAGVAALPTEQGQAAPKADTTLRTPPAPRASAAAPAAGGFDALLKQVSAPATAGTDVNPYAEDFRKLGEARVAAKREQAEGLEAIQKQYADIFKGREERLSKREGELGEMKDKSLGLALLQAGAAMMTTPGNLGMALGKGVDVGSRQYVAGMEKVNAAKERLADARDRLEELQAQRGEMSARELLKAKNEIKTEEAGAQELLIKANMDFYKISREEAMKRLELQTRVGIAQLETQARKEVAAAGNRNPTLELLQAVQKDPSLAQAYQALHGTKNDLMSQYTDYLGKNPTGTIEDFLKTKAAFSALSNVKTLPVSALPPGATVAPR